MTCALFMLLATSLYGQECSDCEEIEVPKVTPLCRGKIEIAPAYIHIDFLKSGHTYHRIDLPAVRGDFYYRVWQGLQIRTNAMYGYSRHQNEYAAGGVGLAFCIPLLPKKLSITPLAGFSWSYLHSPFKHRLKSDNAPTTVFHLKQRFRSRSQFIGAELSWTIIPAWRLTLGYQWAWSRTHTKISNAPIEVANERSKSKGPTVSGMLEHDFNDSFSVNLGAAYNNSLSKEKHGVRGWGLKLGFAYWF